MNGTRRKKYPKDWEEQARACKEQSGWRCVRCKIKHGAKRVSKRTGVVYTVYLHAAHVNHDPDNPTPELICLCPTCHGKYDYRARMKRQQLNHERLKHQLLLTSR